MTTDEIPIIFLRFAVTNSWFVYKELNRNLDETQVAWKRSDRRKNKERNYKSRKEYWLEDDVKSRPVWPSLERPVVFCDTS